MIMRRELLVALTGAVALHCCLILFSMNFHETPSSASRASHAQAWFLSSAQVLNSVDESKSLEQTRASIGSINETYSSVDVRKANSPATEKILSSTFGGGFSKSEYLSLEETDTPALPAANWILPFKKGYLDGVASIVVRVWIQNDGAIVGAELLDVRPAHLSLNQMQEIVDWLANTPMSPATKNGENVASKRTVEIAFEH